MAVYEMRIRFKSIASKELVRECVDNCVKRGLPPDAKVYEVVCEEVA